MKNKKLTLSEGYDPYDSALKTLFHEKADNLNFIGQPSGYPQLLCGAVRKGKPCYAAAGRGTNHNGYGRCYNHGGASTGPKTHEGLARSSQNSRKHGFFSSAFTPEEYEYFKVFCESGVNLVAEITLWKSKILRYLKQNADKWKRVYEENKALGDVAAEECADRETRRICSTFNGASNAPRSLSYHTGTIEDKALLKALDVLGRLIEVQAKLRPLDDSTADDIIKQLNQELQAASYGQVSISLTRE